jgi:hypothetical protein
VRIALRGGVVARVSCGTDAAYELSGAEVTTWSERFVAGATRIEITVEETDAASALPVQSGIVCAAAVSAELETSDAAPIVAVLGPAPRIDEIESGASAAALGGGPAPVLALFGVPSAPHVDDVPDAPAAETSVVEPAEQDDTPASDVEEPPSVEPAEQDESPASDVEAGDEQVLAVEEPPFVERAERDETPASDVEAGDERFDSVAGAPSLNDLEGEEPSPDDNGLDEHTWEPPAQTFAPSGDAATSDIDEFEQLFGETLHSGSEQPAAPSVIPPLPAAELGDHDGATITSSELAALRQRRSTSDETATQVIPVVPGSAGRIRVSTGQVVELDRTVIIGRRPRSTRASGDSMPHLVAVESPQQDISRNHLEVRPEAGSVVVIDLHTTTGSTLLRPGADPVRLHPGEQTLVLSGDVVDLGDGVTIAFEALS